MSNDQYWSVNQRCYILWGYLRGYVLRGLRPEGVMSLRHEHCHIILFVIRGSLIQIHDHFHPEWLGTANTEVLEPFTVHWVHNGPIAPWLIGLLVRNQLSLWLWDDTRQNNTIVTGLQVLSMLSPHSECDNYPWTPMHRSNDADGV